MNPWLVGFGLTLLVMLWMASVVIRGRLRDLLAEAKKIRELLERKDMR